MLRRIMDFYFSIAVFLIIYLGSCPVQTYPLNPKIQQLLYLVRNVDPYQCTQ